MKTFRKDLWSLTPVRLPKERHRHIERRVAILLAILTLFISPCLAQVESGTTAGTVTDATGAVIPDAAVTVTNVASNVKRITQTSGTGSYSVVGLAPAPTRSRSIQGSSSLTPPTSRSPWVAM